MQVIAGILLLARFRAEGFAAFGTTTLAFMNSLAPMLAITLVTSLRPLLAGNARQLGLHVMTSLIALLGPAVLWLRYIGAFNWCQSVITLVTVVLILLLAAGGNPAEGMGGLVAAIAAVLIYWIAVCWFMARHGLEIGRLKAVLAVIVINVGTGLLMLGPQIIAAMLQPIAPVVS